MDRSQEQYWIRKADVKENEGDEDIMNKTDKEQIKALKILAKGYKNKTFLGGSQIADGVYISINMVKVKKKCSKCGQELK